ncbi:MULTISPECIES: DUF86 domain-containing protein [unclassified Meiothermus]|uniref:HepT-like ribonuclease domain-containing protein n=1 Tax=unclassified Meiothermus TaxID=370471 RepID=UPI000D7C39C8|nr:MULTISPECIES: DUF86 domain-containing protein [unclassified Meiothermus]PZA05961.1 DUF86 domain-containing protein [Meiothermus sp. Pnk-1]RYM27537.1 DUF86 domain-containing protein [Meiothermus sp. PNK-Is4]
MRASALEVLDFTRGMTFEAFLQDRKTINAVIRSLEVFPQNVRVRHSDIPWRDVAGMRDKLIHEYHGVDLEIVWRTVQEDVPALLPRIEKVLAEERARERVRREGDGASGGEKGGDPV